MNEYKIKVTEVLERVVTVDANTADDAVEQVEQQYNNEDIVLDYNDHVSTDIVPESACTIVLTDAKDGTVILYHLQKEPDDIELWLSDNYKNYDSNCSYMITKKEVEHGY